MLFFLLKELAEQLPTLSSRGARATRSLYFSQGLKQMQIPRSLTAASKSGLLGTLGMTITWRFSTDTLGKSQVIEQWRFQLTLSVKVRDCWEQKLPITLPIHHEAL